MLGKVFNLSLYFGFFALKKAELTTYISYEDILDDVCNIECNWYIHAHLLLL